MAAELYEGSPGLTSFNNSDGGDVSEPEQASAVLSVPHTEVGAIIGRGGRVIQHIQSLSGAHVHISRLKDMPKGGTDRQVTITGTAEAVEEARALIEAKLAGEDIPPIPEEPAPPAPMPLEEMTSVFAVQNSQVGAIIGPGGAMIRQIQQLSGAKLQISKKEDMAPGSEERTVSITGTPLAVSTATQIVSHQLTMEQQKMFQVPFFGAFPPGPYVGEGMPAYGYAATPYAPTEPASLVLHVANNCVGAIIGKRGETIKQISAMSGARVQIAQREESTGDTRAVTITGPPASVAVARDLVLRKVQDEEERHAALQKQRQQIERSQSEGGGDVGAQL